MSNTAVPTWELHHRLARALEWGQVTAEEMAETLGVHVNSIYNYASGRRIPKRGFVMQWALRCGVPADWLEHGGFGDDDGTDGGTRAVTLGYRGTFDREPLNLLVAA